LFLPPRSHSKIYKSASEGPVRWKGDPLRHADASAKGGPNWLRMAAYKYQSTTTSFD